MKQDVLEKWAWEIANSETQLVADLAAEVRGIRDRLAKRDLQVRELQARVAELEEIKRKAIEQSEYIQSHGLTEYEMARLKARVAELETQTENLRERAKEYQNSYGNACDNLKERGEAILSLLARVAELETQCDRGGLKIAHEPTPGVDYVPVEMTYHPSVVTNAPGQPAQVTFYPQEVVYTPGELSQYPSKTVGEP